ncbi:MAG: dihydroorotase family protein [Nitrososphaerota archaeon]
MSLIIKGKIHTGEKIIKGSILIEDEKIAKVVVGEINQTVSEKVDFSAHENIIILPGLIDIHAHLRDLDYSYKEDFISGTRAAAKGGYTIVADMPNTKPKTNNIKNLIDKNNLADSKALIDYAFYYGFPNNENDLGNEVTKLCSGIKIYSYEDYYFNKNNKIIEKVFSFAFEKSIPIIVHAENPIFFKGSGSNFFDRPVEAEISAVKDFLEISKKHGFHLHITHVSSAISVKIIEKHRFNGYTNVTIDTCPHYIFLDETSIRFLGSFAKVHPPLRKMSDCLYLLKSLKNGVIDIVSSDHAPHSFNEKMKPYEEAPAGFPGLETTVPLLLTLVNKNEVSLERFIELFSINPAKLLNIKKVGLIKEGYYGNITIVDMKHEEEIKAEYFESRAKYSPFNNWKIKGKPIATIVRGKTIMLNNEVFDFIGWGKNVRTYD